MIHEKAVVFIMMSTACSKEVSLWSLLYILENIEQHEIVVDFSIKSVQCPVLSDIMVFEL